MDQVLSNIRDIMFLSSIAIAQYNVTEYVLSFSEGTYMNQDSRPFSNLHAPGKIQFTILTNLSSVSDLSLLLSEIA